MKQSLILSSIMLFMAFNMCAQNDTIYFFKNGSIINRQSVKAIDLDSVIFYNPQKQAANTFTDSRDGNVYKTIKINNQLWMAENLRYLPSVVGSGTGSTTTPYYYVYEYNGTNVIDAKATENYKTYGVLYNFSAAIISCPAGWHLPSDAEWTQLTNYLGGESVSGGKLKEVGTAHWKSPNTGAINSVGFNALPGGYYDNYQNGKMYNKGETTSFWSSTEGSTGAWFRIMGYSYEAVGRINREKDYGYSVRCIKD